MLEEKLSYDVIGCCIKVHKIMGPGLLEACYHNALYYELQNQGHIVKYNAPYIVKYQGQNVGEYFADLLIDKKILLELKSVKQFSETHEAQLINYLHISGIRVGYLVNFQNFKLGFKRLVV